MLCATMHPLECAISAARVFIWDDQLNTAHLFPEKVGNSLEANQAGH